MWLLFGWICFGLGAIGALLPVMPTVPFMILAAYCFSRGSERWHRWLLARPHIGPMVHDWYEHKVIRRRAKVTATLLLLCSVVSMSVVLNLTPIWIVTVLLIASSVAGALWMFPDAPRDAPPAAGAAVTPKRETNGALAEAGAVAASGGTECSVTGATSRTSDPIR